jgi:transcriptional regulator with XRE-family HTH domain
MRTLRNRFVDIGRERARHLAQRFGRELRIARVGMGLTQRQLALRSGVSQGFVSLVERGLRTPSWPIACQLSAAVGCELSLKLFPAEGVGLRDSGQASLAEVIAEAAHPRWRARLEVPLGDGSRRAVDIGLDHEDEVVALEIERGLVDLQAQYRAATLKRNRIAGHESRPVRLVIGVPDTPAIARVLAAHDALIQRALPVPSRAIWSALHRGTVVGGDGILLIPRPSRRRRLAG